VTTLRAAVCGLVIVLVLAPALGFAAGGQALHLWNKHPRHTGGHDVSPSRAAWKTTPGAPSPSLPALVWTLVGRLSPPAPVLVTPPMPRPPFVPPRA
jgi:hypothetical protein